MTRLLSYAGRGGLWLAWLVFATYTIIRLALPFLTIWDNGSIILIDSFLPWFGGALCVGAGWAIWQRAYWLARMLLIAVGCWAWAFAPLFLPPTNQQLPQSGFKLRVVSYSVWYHNPQHDVTAIAQLLAAQQPDVILLQEIDAATWEALEPALQAQWQPNFYGVVNTEKRLLQGVLSRYPVTLVGSDSEHTRVLQTQLATPYGTVHVWNVHAFRPNYLPGRNFLSYSSDFADRHQRAAEQFDWLQSQAAIIHEPFILAGDLNLPDLAFAHQQLSSGTLRDAFWQAGYGFGLNYPANPMVGRRISVFGWDWYATIPFPLVKLDHLLYSEHFTAQSAAMLPNSAGSDHAPLSVVLQLLADSR